MNHSELSRLVGDEIAKNLAPIQGLLKTLKEPASAVGVTPEALLSTMSKQNPDGFAVLPNGTPITSNRSKGSRPIGWGKFLLSLAEYQRRGSLATEAIRYLDELGVKSVHVEGERYTRAALAESTGTTGGYTVPPQFVNQLLAIAGEESVVAKYATAMPMTGLTAQVPALDMTTGASGVSAFLGGVSATWTAEAATRTETEPTFKQITARAHELALYTVASNNLLADNAVGLDSLLTRLISASLAFYTDYAYLRGTGVSKPLGILNSAATITVTRNTSSHIYYADIVGMYSRIYSGLFGSSSLVWLANQSCIPELLQLKDGANRAIFVSIDQGATKEPTWMLLGRPVIFTEKLPAMGTSGDIMLADLSKYLCFNRAELQIDVSPHVKFLTNQMTWRAIWRGDGQPWLTSPITLADGSTTVSPFVVLTT